jgi:riboflavin transporter
MSITTTLSKIQVGYLAKFILLLGLAIGAPILGIHSQWITGPIVNAALILSVFLVGVRGAVLIGLLPSTIALGVGLLPAPLAAMVPFIIISNIILVFVISFFRHSDRSPSSGEGGVEESLRYSISERRSDSSTSLTLFAPLGMTNIKYFIGLITAAVLKFLFLFLTSGIVIKLLLNQKLAPAVAQMMSWPQFYTALIGGALAFIILKIFKK